MVTSGHVTKMIRHSRKPMLQANFMALCFIEPELLPIEVLHRGKTFLLLWPWPWPDDLHIRTWTVFSGDISDVQNFLCEGLRKLLSDRDSQTRPRLYTTPFRECQK